MPVLVLKKGLLLVHKNFCWFQDPGNSFCSLAGLSVFEPNSKTMPACAPIGHPAPCADSSQRRFSLS